MATGTESSNADASPLLRRLQGEYSNSTRAVPGAAPLTVILGRVTGRRGSSMLVRESAARELEERRADWGYSKPVVALDMMWNMAFVIVSVVMLVCTLNEETSMPIRIWIGGYAFQCLVHVILVSVEFRRRNRRRRSGNRGWGEDGGGGVGASRMIEAEEEDGSVGFLGLVNQSSAVKRCESINTMASFIWWMVGFYWIVSGGVVLLQNAPRLYWLAVVFLGFDVFFAVFCVVLACLIGIALCCCLPCIIALLYAVAGQEGATEADLSLLPTYRYQILKDEDKGSGGAGRMIPIDASSGYLANERVLLPEDAECCICLCVYEDGAELHALPCNHNFHSACIVKWLKMNATCPLCKYNVLKGNEAV